MKPKHLTNPIVRLWPAASLALALSLAPGASGASATITVSVDQPAHRVPPTLWGIFFEDINCSADGGIYPELVRNLSFEDAAEPEHWELVNRGEGGSEMVVDSSRPLNPFNRHSLKVKLDEGAVIGNAGYWGMNVVEGETYLVKLAARVADGFDGPLTVWLEDRDGRDLAQCEFTALTDQWQWFTQEVIASGSDVEAKLAIRAKGSGTLWLDMVSVLPKQTWKDHGMRPDLCEMLDALDPAFFRFPGGCWVEGDDMAHMYRWKETIGDIACRKPLYNIWGYHATHGLGYHEYLQLAEDLGAEPMFCINVGMSHKEVVPLDQMGPWVQDALDAIEYANGPTNSLWGRLRAENGHPEPFHMKYLEIGNENGGSAYNERWELFHRAIKAKYPEMQLVANVWGGYPTNRIPEIVDEHYYNNPEFFIQQAGHYDDYDRNGPKVFVGEYAVTQGAGRGNLRGAIGEAAFMTGLERNSDVVVMAAYAPLFVNVNHRKWNPDLINFDSSGAYGLPSYYVQQLFSVHQGDVVLPIVVSSPEAETELQGGMIGVGTWATRAEFKDIKVSRGNDILYACDFSDGTEGWKLLDGSWKTENGVLRQDSLDTNVRAIVPGKNWTNYTYSLKARKLEGDEGFLILFNVTDEQAKSWWNIGGWGNDHHALELGGVSGREARGSVETDRWYDIRVEVDGKHVQCFLDGELVNEGRVPVVKSIHASATREEASGEVIVKVVNASPAAQDVEIQLDGAGRITGPARAIVLTSERPEDENSIEEPTKVAPQIQGVPISGKTLRHSFPGNSFTVLRIQAD